MKNKLIILATGIPFLTFAQSAFADVNPCTGADGISKILCGFTGDNMGKVIGGILNFMFVVAIIFSLAYLVYGGIKWIISEGDKQKVADARGHIMAAIIGLVLVFLSYFILTLVLKIFGLDLNNLTITPIPQ
jgi:hypothetical protein